MARWNAERRRSERASVRRQAWSETPTPTSVQVLDIGIGGVGLSAPQRFEIGERGRFTTTFGGIELGVDVEIRSVRKQGDRYRVSARFVAFDGARRLALQ